MTPRWGLLALVLLAPALAAQEPRLAARLDSTTLAAVTALVDSGRAEGLPAEPLVQKALEGASKGADGPRILMAVRSLLGHLRAARAALGTGSSEVEVVAGAAALRAGAGLDALRDLRRARGSRGVAVPLAVLADLVADGVQVETAARSVLDLARTTAEDEEFVRLKQRLGRSRP